MKNLAFMAFLISTPFFAMAQNSGSIPDIKADPVVSATVDTSVGSVMAASSKSNYDLEESVVPSDSITNSGRNELSTSNSTNEELIADRSDEGLPAADLEDCSLPSHTDTFAILHENFCLDEISRISANGVRQVSN